MRPLLRLLLVLAAIGGASAVFHATVATALAECPPTAINEEFLSDVPRAKAEAVGTIRSIAQSESQGLYVTSVAVERGYGAGGVLRRAIWPGSCIEPRPKVGDRVIVLIGMLLRGGGTTRVDDYFTIGASVSQDVARRVSARIPDTDAVPAKSLAVSGAASSASPLPFVLAGGLGFAFALRRGGALRLRPRPRTRAA